MGRPPQPQVGLVVLAGAAAAGGGGGGPSKRYPSLYFYLGHLLHPSWFTHGKMNNA